MTNILLSIIIVLLIARFILSVWQGKKTLDKAYATTSEVDAFFEFAALDEIKDKLRKYSRNGYELSCAMPYTMSNGEFRVFFFFTRKKIKNYMEK